MSDATDRPTVIVLGASSPIARALATRFATRGYALVLGGRDTEELRRIGADLHVRFDVPVQQFEYDALRETDGAAPFNRTGKLAGVVVAIGLLGEEARARRDPAHADEIRRANYTGVAPFLQAAAEALAQRGGGFVICISSVASDRLRQANYTYGSAKAELDALLEQLRARYANKGVRVMTVKPGFVDTAMIWQRRRPLTAQPDRVADDIVRALDAGEDVMYTPWYWRWIMLGMRSLPGPVFRRLPF